MAADSSPLIHVRLDDATYRWLETRGAREGRTRSNFVQVLLKRAREADEAATTAASEGDQNAGN